MAAALAASDLLVRPRRESYARRRELFQMAYWAAYVLQLEAIRRLVPATPSRTVYLKTASDGTLAVDVPRWWSVLAVSALHMSISPLEPGLQASKVLLVYFGVGSVFLDGIPSSCLPAAVLHTAGFAAVAVAYGVWYYRAWIRRYLRRAQEAGFSKRGVFCVVAAAPSWSLGRMASEHSFLIETCLCARRPLRRGLQQPPGGPGREEPARQARWCPARVG